LLAEIDRSLWGHEQAAKSNVWLGDAGLNAEARLVSEASDPRDQGQRASAVDLAPFVRDVVLMDGGNVEGTPDDEVFSVLLPPAWRSALGEVPGHDGESRRVRLTTRLGVMQDAAGNTVGFLGRSHPLVRKALDGVRNLSLGGAGQSGQDPRVSAVAADVAAPELLCTLLCRVLSDAGRELERVLAVRLNPQGEPRVYDSAEDWIQLADRRRAVRTTDLRRNHFREWADKAQAEAKRAAEDAFTAMADGPVRERQTALARERAEHLDWLRARTTEITERAEPASPQLRLIPESSEAAATPQGPASPWEGVADSAERLAVFARDRSQPPSKRSEAEGVLRLYRQRLIELDAGGHMQPPEVMPLGVLMLVPEWLDRQGSSLVGRTTGGLERRSPSDPKLPSCRTSRQG
jgi:hypothetical protein